MNKSCIPVKFLIWECITWLFMLFPVVFMFLDFFYCWTKLSAWAYLFTSLCGLSLFVTTKIAKKEWIAKNKGKCN